MPENTVFGRWIAEPQPLGRGGQGSVYLARKTDYQATIPAQEFLDAVRNAAEYTFGEVRTEAGRKLISIIEAIAQSVVSREKAQLGALKVLHPITDRDAADKARTRQEREVHALQNFPHPSLVRLFDQNPAERWFVMEYFEHGTMEGHRRYTGDVLGALRAIKPIVEAVAVLHSNGFVHRDIKPENIFVAAEGHLVLGDFGLIIDPSAKESRLTDTYENVGSKNWMPMWAMGVRMDQVTPAFDVFSLGKVLWSMISGRSFLRLWYYDHDEFNLEKQFPNDARMKWANRLLKSCVVEREGDCLKDARQLLEKINETVAAMERGGQIFRNNQDRINCHMCGVGFVGVLKPIGAEDMVLHCGHCGYRHSFRGVKDLPQWTAS